MVVLGPTNAAGKLVEPRAKHEVDES